MVFVNLMLTCQNYYCKREICEHNVEFIVEGLKFYALYCFNSLLVVFHIDFNGNLDF